MPSHPVSCQARTSGGCHPVPCVRTPWATRTRSQLVGSEAARGGGRPATCAIAVRSFVAALTVVLALVTLGSLGASPAGALGISDALALGVIEGVTEFLPISSTGHLAVAERMLGVLEGPGNHDAAAAYAICLQAGAIAAVAVLYRGRLSRIAAGLCGRDPDGARLARMLLLAAAPTGVVGLVLGSVIKDQLFGIGPIVWAWAAGGVAILLLAPRLQGGVTPLEQLHARAAIAIGAAQVLALWPGVSRSLVTILGALAVGLTMSAAVEFSFLMGLLTLGAATGYEGVRQGGVIIERFGLVSPLVGLLAAFLSALVAIRWLTTVVERRPLDVFGWYRLSIAAIVGLLALSGAV